MSHDLRHVVVADPRDAQVRFVAVHECVSVADWREGPAFEEVVEVDDGLDGDDGDA